MSDKKPEAVRVSSIPPFGLRMLPELRERIASAAQENGRSLNGEIVSRLEASLKPIASPKLEDGLASYSSAELLAYTMVKMAEEIEHDGAPPSKRSLTEKTLRRDEVGVRLKRVQKQVDHVSKKLGRRAGAKEAK